MTELWQGDDAYDRRLALAATGPLADWNAAGVLTAGDVHVARTIGRLAGEADEAALLVTALTVRAVRHGSVCLDLATIADRLPEGLTAAPDPPPATSPLVRDRILHVEAGLVYLDRYHLLERQVADQLSTRIGAVDGIDQARATALADTLDGHFSPEQQRAALAALTRRTVVLTGGPGTGKTTTVARMLLLLADQHAGQRLRVVLAAPTGKAAARLTEAVNSELALAASTDQTRAAVRLLSPLAGVTLHRLLGWRPDNRTRFAHHRGNRLGADLVVVDESSMVDLTMMARLLEALRPDTRLLLVGDPDQLTSVGAGAVLADIVAGCAGTPDSPVLALTENFRATRDIQGLADALRSGDPDLVLDRLRTSSTQITFVETDDPAAVEAAVRADCLPAAEAAHAAAVEGDADSALAALRGHRLLCAHREGPHGVRRWNSQVEQWLAEETGEDMARVWYPGRPLLVTRNDRALDLYNGETGVVVQHGSRLRAHIEGGDRTRDFAPVRLDAVQTMHALTIHKAQGSEADQITVLLPEADSRLLTRELFYTALTRARHHVRIIGSEEAVRAAVLTRASRATGLAGRLSGQSPVR
ncbi:exodeoxyribonuclease V subunit alpha [Nocardioides limicola]|uniref:exodeoxyribonuclease V subunit alpha n=1 Tax=Nocardioides limicola TaxID=2803368 RepID=UPI00193C263A|nr:exodeoxyribonuclease V subunit alpha [Nocardioides sp. DJM-14]